MVDQIKFIEDDRKRRVAYSKRKRGILKKAMELSSMCSVDIFMVIFDRKMQKFVEYRSTEDFNSKICNQITSNARKKFLTFQYVTNKDYQKPKGRVQAEKAESQESDTEDKSEGKNIEEAK